MKYCLCRVKKDALRRGRLGSSKLKVLGVRVIVKARFIQPRYNHDTTATVCFGYETKGQTPETQSQLNQGGFIQYSV